MVRVATPQQRLRHNAGDVHHARLARRRVVARAGWDELLHLLSAKLVLFLVGEAPAVRVDLHIRRDPVKLPRSELTLPLGTSSRYPVIELLLRQHPHAWPRWRFGLAKKPLRSRTDAGTRWPLPKSEQIEDAEGGGRNAPPRAVQTLAAEDPIRKLGSKSLIVGARALQNPIPRHPRHPVVTLSDGRHGVNAEGLRAEQAFQLANLPRVPPLA
jgi:hypothetical protein